MYTVFVLINAFEVRMDIAAASRGAAVSEARRQHPGCTIVSVQ